jgi:uncharacterized protein
MDDVRHYTGTLVADLHLPHAHSLKDRRQALRSLVQRLQNHHYSVAQIGPPDLQQRAFLAVAAVAGSRARLDELLDAAERIIFAGDFEVADLRRLTQQDSFASGG